MKFKIRDHLVSEIENQLQLILHALRYEEVHGRIDGQTNLIGSQAEEVKFLFVVGIRITSP